MTKLVNERLVSLDLFRGLTMLLLVAEGANLYNFFYDVVPDNTVLRLFSLQFFHAEWHGMRFWDLIQPYFTFIIGVAMAFSLKKRWESGAGWFTLCKHFLFRCAVLFILGLMLQSVYRGKLVWELWNILTQLSISILITFLVFRFSYMTQLIISFGLLVITELLYRYVLIEGFEQPFVIHHNFGAFIDQLLMGKIHRDGWVAFNCIPTTAHMIWGLLTGNILMGTIGSGKEIKILGLASLIAFIIGYGLDWSSISPINKKIATSSFILVSGGWCLVSFLIMYWLVDIKGYRRGITLFSVIGMNPIFIYVFSRSVGRIYLNEYVPRFTKWIMGWIISSEGLMNLTAYMTVLGLQWYLCYWLYRKKIFIKI